MAVMYLDLIANYGYPWNDYFQQLSDEKVIRIYLENSNKNRNRNVIITENNKDRQLHTIKRPITSY